MLQLYLLLLQVEDPFLQVVVLDHQVRGGVVLGETVVYGVAHSVGLGSADSVVALDRRANEDVLQVF